MIKRNNLLSLLGGVAIAAMSTIAFAEGGNGSNGGDGSGGNADGGGGGAVTPGSNIVYGGTCAETTRALDAMRANPGAFTNGWEGAKAIGAIFGLSEADMMTYAEATTGVDYTYFPDAARVSPRLSMVIYFVDTFFTAPLPIWNHTNVDAAWLLYLGYGYSAMRSAQMFGLGAYDTDGGYVSPDFMTRTEPGRQMPNGCVYGSGGSYLPPTAFKPNSGGYYGSQSGIRGNATNIYGVVPGWTGRTGQAVGGDSTSQRIMN